MRQSSVVEELGEVVVPPVREKGEAAHVEERSRGAQLTTHVADPGDGLLRRASIGCGARYVTVM